MKIPTGEYGKGREMVGIHPMIRHGEGADISIKGPQGPFCPTGVGNSFLCRVHGVVFAVLW